MKDTSKEIIKLIGEHYAPLGLTVDVIKTSIPATFGESKYVIKVGDKTLGAYFKDTTFYDMWCAGVFKELNDEERTTAIVGEVVGMVVYEINRELELDSCENGNR